DHRAPPAPARPLRHRPGRRAAWRPWRRVSGPGSLYRTGVRCAGAVARRYHSVPLGAFVGRSHETWLRTNVAPWTVISRWYGLSIHVGTTTPGLFLPCRAYRPPGPDRVSSGSRAGTKVGVFHRTFAI